MMHLWEIDHSYYCTEGDNSTDFESFDDFLDEMKHADMDYNLLFRWDWKPEDSDDERPHDELQLSYFLQRKGYLYTCNVQVTKEDEQRVIEFLTPHWQHMFELWQGISLNKVEQS